MRSKILLTTVLLTAFYLFADAQQKKKTTVAAPAAQTGRPNILIIMGDDIGSFNISAYNMGMMGYKTPNIDRIGKEGIVFTDFYGQQSCTAGRAAFITGQSPIRSGLLKVGLPGAKEGITKLDPTLAEMLKPLGYLNGQFGKNHLGDLDEHLPTNHGFDEFFGNLYHLNAEEEPENPDYPKSPEFKKNFGPRGVIHSTLNADGTQRIEDTGPLTKKRMETIDDEVAVRTLAFMDRAKKENKPFFIWFNTTRMHVITHLKPASDGVTGLGVEADGMVEHDKVVGQLLDKLKALGLDENTIVMYTTDNGNELLAWPDGGSSIFRGEKNSQWEGGYRIPALIKWPGKIEPGTVNNEICSLEDMVPTLMAAVGDTSIKEDLLKGKQIGNATYKAHLDGYNLLRMFMKGGESPRKEFIYWTDGGSVAALRYGNWKVTFLRQDSHGLHTWIEPFTELRAPMICNLRMDPFERAQDEAIGYGNWYFTHMFAFAPAAAYVGKWIQSFKEFPPRMKPGSFNLDRVMESITYGSSGGEK